ncbi:COG2129 Predicted phosphoesterases, related to the Icc protein [uncultured Caudovirales phage]|uniref:COG2129 Predicted phosphoesterases, related to the Icc protein n=1 Tax=uncultured Caudovirales phage TaxID=2100421 RepID=A0A6J5M7Y0_9CAUD|nr:COG2129 Predicted phosphoesterases, related to the Icc protein [uncultured Caudovirales phage]
MKIVCISDTHCKHNKLVIPECDVLIFSGDMCSSGELWQVSNFSKWLKKYESNFDRAFVIAGNHDRCFQNMKLAAIEELQLFDKIVYLEDSEFVYNGIKFYGSPWQPMFNNWAFNATRGEKLQNIWSNIPEDTNVLITHGPPHGIGDLVSNIHVGCIDLLHKISTLSNLFLHVFGHIHDGNGHYISEAIPNVNFCNAAICDESYYSSNPAYEVNLINTGSHHFVSVNPISLINTNASD